MNGDTRRMLHLLLILCGPVVTDLDFAVAPLELCRQLDGRTVRASFAFGAPAWNTHGVTLLGVGDQDDMSERWALVPTCDAEVGDLVAVVGVLRVIEHEASSIGGVDVPAWTEVRVDTARMIEP